ncbi:MAG: hypothetical protein ACK5AJ_01705 [bacterium]
MRRLILVLVALSLLGGCEKPERENTYLPLAEGLRWVYKVEITFDDPESFVDTSTLTITNRGRHDINGTEAWRRRTDSGNEYWLRSDEKGVYRIASRGPASKTAVLDAASRTVIPAKLTQDEKWSIPTMPYFLKRRSEWPPEFKYVDKYRYLTMDFSIEATGQAVKTPAGDFNGCLIIKGIAPITLWVETETTYKPVPIVSREWYCPGVGLVQLERKEPTTARFFQGGVLRMTLTEFN